MSDSPFAGAFLSWTACEDRVHHYTLYSKSSGLIANTQHDDSRTMRSATVPSRIARTPVRPSVPTTPDPLRPRPGTRRCVSPRARPRRGAFRPPIRPTRLRTSASTRPGGPGPIPCAHPQRLRRSRRTPTSPTDARRHAGCAASPCPAEPRGSPVRARDRSCRRNRCTRPRLRIASPPPSARASPWRQPAGRTSWPACPRLGRGPRSRWIQDQQIADTPRARRRISTNGFPVTACVLSRKSSVSFELTTSSSRCCATSRASPGFHFALARFGRDCIASCMLRRTASSTTWITCRRASFQRAIRIA